MRRLTLIRHARSSWKETSLDDFDRPLNMRGKKNAPEMGRRLAQQHFRPDMMLASPAARALATAQLIAEQIGWPIDRLVREPRIYGADVDELIAVIRGLEDSWRHVALFGHNPGFTDLGNWLAAAAVDNLPTCAVLDLELDIASWSQAGKRTGRVLQFDYPKKT